MMNKDDLTVLRDLTAEYFKWCKDELTGESGEEAWNEAKITAGFLEFVEETLEEKEAE